MATRYRRMCVKRRRIPTLLDLMPPGTRMVWTLRRREIRRFSDIPTVMVITAKIERDRPVAEAGDRRR